MHYKLLGTHTGVPVSTLALGAANLGSRKGYGAAADEIPLILSAYTDAGGNFIDVADQYQLGEAEEIVGKFIESRRDEYVICSKYTRSSEPAPAPAKEGNHRKAMRAAVDASLKRLRTDYIDIYMPHYDDGRTPLEEIARGLEDVVRAGKVLYGGLANFPAWKVAGIAGAGLLAGAGSGLLTTIQVEYNLAQRMAERELMPMAGYYGIAQMFYSPLAGGMLTGKYRRGGEGRLNRLGVGAAQEDVRTGLILDELELIAGEIGVTSGQVALAWVLTRGGFPIIGARSLAQLRESLGAVDIELSAEQVSRLDSVSAVSMGYPHELLQTVQRRY